LRGEKFKLVRYYDPSKPYKKQEFEEEFYDLRKNGDDYSKISQRALESLNYSPWAEEMRLEDGSLPISTKRITKAYKKSSAKLDEYVELKLQPLPLETGKKPTLATRLTKSGKRVEMFEIHRKSNSSEFELAFNSRRDQYYTIQLKENYTDSSGELQSVWTNLGGGAIKGTNNPVYTYYKGLPLDLRKSHIRVASVFSSSESNPSTPFSLGYDFQTIDELINPIFSSAKGKESGSESINEDSIESPLRLESSLNITPVNIERSLGNAMAFNEEAVPIISSDLF
jgi:hypothetical protein